MKSSYPNLYVIRLAEHRHGQGDRFVAVAAEEDPNQGLSVMTKIYATVTVRAADKRILVGDGEPAGPMTALQAAALGDCLAAARAYVAALSKE